MFEPSPTSIRHIGSKTETTSDRFLGLPWLEDRAWTGTRKTVDPPTNESTVKSSTAQLSTISDSESELAIGGRSAMICGQDRKRM
jgi:hypothetical protein